MKNGIYFVIVCEKVDRNGIAVNPINCEIAECDYPQFKKEIEKKDWKIYCRSTIESPNHNPLDEVTEIEIL